MLAGCGARPFGVCSTDSVPSRSTSTTSAMHTTSATPAITR
jgi:hypothetical protein